VEKVGENLQQIRQDVHGGSRFKLAIGATRNAVNSMLMRMPRVLTVTSFLLHSPLFIDDLLWVLQMRECGAEQSMNASIDRVKWRQIIYSHETIFIKQNLNKLNKW